MKYSHLRRSLPGLLFTLVASGLIVVPAWGHPCFQTDKSGAKEIEPADEAMARFQRLNGELGALFFAVEVGDDAKALQLIAGGVDLSLKWNGESIMDLVVKRGRLAVFRELVDVGVAPVLSMGKKVTEADLQPPIGRRWTSYVYGPMPGSEIRSRSLIQSASSGDDEIVRELLAEGEDVNQTRADGWGAIHGAAELRSGPMVQLLIDNGAKFNLRGGPLGRTPLEVALQSRGNDSSVKALLDAGVKLTPDQEDARGTSLLHLASQNGYLHIMRELIASGAITNARATSLRPRKNWWIHP